VKKAEMDEGWLKVIFKKEGKADGQKGSGKKRNRKGKRNG